MSVKGNTMKMRRVCHQLADDLCAFHDMCFHAQCTVTHVCHAMRALPLLPIASKCVHCLCYNDLHPTVAPQSACLPTGVGTASGSEHVNQDTGAACPPSPIPHLCSDVSRTTVAVSSQHVFPSLRPPLCCLSACETLHPPELGWQPLTTKL